LLETCQGDRFMQTSKPWVIVLGAGFRERSILECAIGRARRLAPATQVLIVVAEDRAASWESELSSVDRGNVLSEPRDCGTAAGVLLALVHILKRDHGATVVVLPSDHAVADEEALRAVLEQAVGAVQADPEYLVLLVRRPDAARPEDQATRGAAGTPLLLAAAGRTLLLCYGELPELLEPFLRDLVVSPRENVLDELYSTLPARDFSGDLLARARDRLRLMTVPS
jgi:hypothetical protein